MDKDLRIKQLEAEIVRLRAALEAFNPLAPADNRYALRAKALAAGDGEEQTV